MTTTDATRSPVRLGMLAAAMTLAATILLPAAGHAQTRGSQTDEERRDQVFRNGEQAADQRTQSQRSVADGQQERLNYQIRRAKRANRQMQCRSNGLPKEC